MKCLVITYINSDKLLADIEGIMDYYQFKAIESNNHFRVFTGYFNGGPGEFADKLNKELEDVDFEIEDSLFVAYPLTDDRRRPSLSNLIIKRKGNKHLQKKMIT